MIIQIRAASSCAFVATLLVSSLVFAQVKLDRAFVDIDFRRWAEPQVVYAGLPAAPGLPLRQQRATPGSLWSTEEQAPDTTLVELDLEHWSANAAQAMLDCTDGVVEEGRVAQCLDDVIQTRGEPCSATTTTMCRSLDYYSSWCGRRAQEQNWGNTNWICRSALSEALDHLAHQSTVTTELGELDVGRKQVALPRFMSDGASTNELHLERGDAIVCEAPSSSYYEWDGYIHPDDPAHLTLRGISPTPPAGTPPGTTVAFSVVPPPKRFVSQTTDNAVKDCGEAAYKEYLDFSDVEDGAREIDRHRSLRYIVDRVFYGGPRDEIPSHRALATLQPTSQTARADFHSWDGTDIRIPRHYRTWRGQQGRTFKNVYWLIDREAHLPINGSTNEYRRRLRRFYTTDMTWHYRMREGLNHFLPEELHELAQEQKSLYEKYRRYLYLKANADCDVDPTAMLAESDCTRECLGQLSMNQDVFGDSFGPGGQTVLPSTLMTGSDGYPSYAHGAEALVNLASGPLSEEVLGTFEDGYYGEEGMMGPDGMPYGYPSGPPGGLEPSGGGLAPGDDPPRDPPGEENPHWPGTAPISPGTIDPLAPNSSVAGLDCFRRCRGEFESITGLSRHMTCPDEDAKAEYATEAQAYFDTEIAPALERGRKLGCVPTEPDERDPTPCDWADEELVAYFEQSYKPQRLAYWNRCVDRFGPGKLNEQKLTDSFIDPNQMPPGLPPLRQQTIEAIDRFRATEYLVNPDRLWDYLRDFREYQRIVAEDVFGDGGSLGPDGLRSSRTQEKTMGNDWVGTTMRAQTSSGQGLGASRCDVGIDARGNWQLAVAALGGTIDVANMVGAGDTDNVDPDQEGSSGSSIAGAFSADIEIGGEVIYEPGDGETPSRTTVETHLRVSAQYRWTYEFPEVKITLSVLDANVSAGIGATVGANLGFSYRYVDVDPGEEFADSFCSDPSQHTVTISSRPAVGADVYLKLTVGTPGPVSLRIGVMGTLKVIELAYEWTWVHTTSNFGERTVPGGAPDGTDCTIPISDASSNGYDELMLTLMAGSISVIVEIVIGWFALTLLKWDIIRFGGFRIPLSRIGESFEGVDQCLVGELALGLTFPATFTTQLPDDCPCVFRRAIDCTSPTEPPDQGESGTNLCE
ncbi:MAG: hypothetical protein AAFU77_04430 [Myxococcota bacterium]